MWPSKIILETSYIMKITLTESRHPVVCRVAQEAGAPHREYIDWKKEMQFSHINSSVIPDLIIENKFATDVSDRKGSLHTEFEENCSGYFRDTCSQNFNLIFLLHFAHFAKPP